MRGMEIFMKKKIKKVVCKFIKCDGINATIAAIVVLIVFIKSNLVDKQPIVIIDWTIFSTIIAALLLNGLSEILKNILTNLLEDSTKLTDDYEALATRYKCEMIFYDNSNASKNNLERLKKNRKNNKMIVYFPVICAYKLKNCTIDIQDSDERYKLPEIVRNHYDELLLAHSTSLVYNQLMIRVDDWKFENRLFTMKTSRTTFFDSLVTNRAMDFQCKNGLTMREQLEFPPYLHTLKESDLSNHIGFNGFVESSDGFILFVKRGKKLSIGKGTYGNSVGASLKTKYALNNSGEFTEKGLMDGILYEIRDELKIPKNKIENIILNKNLVAAYRDIVEGGKPQLLFYVRSKWNKDKIEENFINEVKKTNKNKRNILLEDGRKLLWIPRAQINQLCILPDMIIYQGKIYCMMPSATASIVMLIEYLREEGGFFENN